MLSTLIKITSTHDTAHTNHSSFRYSLGQHAIGLHEVKAVVLVSAIIPNKQYNVNSNNNVLRYDLNGAGDASLTVPVGQYTTTTLTAYIQSQIAGTTFTQDTTTQKINIATTNTLDIHDIDTDPLSTLAPHLGINTALVIGAASNDDASDIPDLNGTDMFLIHSNALANSNMVSSDDSQVTTDYSVLAVVPVSVNFGFNEVYEHLSSTESIIRYQQPRNINSIDVRITDQHNNNLDLQSPVTLVFRAYY